MQTCLDNTIHPTTQYAISIVSGAINPTCELERLSCKRHLDDLEKQGTDEFPYVFDETRADRIFEWFSRCCRHVRGPFSGQPISLEPFQKFDLGCLFGWVHKDSGKRRFSKSYNQRARGNVKSTEMSGVANYGLCGDCVYPPFRPERELMRFEDMPEVECAAVDRLQAQRVWGDAKAMGEKSPDIMKRLRIKRTFVEHKTRGGWLRALSKDTKNKDSGAPCFVVIDEYHAHPTSEIHDVLYSGFGKRMQSLMFIITTAGKDAENNPCKKEYDTCCKMLRGEIPIPDHYFIMIREMEKGDDVHDPYLRRKANPVLQSDNEYAKVLADQIQKEHDEAYANNDYAKIREFLTKRCNMWQADSEKKFMAGLMDKYKSLAISREEFLKLVHARKCYTGADLSKRIDLTGNGYVFPLDDGRFAVCAHGWLPRERVQWHFENDKMDYEMLQEDKWCTIQDGGVVDTDGIIEYSEAMKVQNKWNILEWDLDMATAYQFATDLQKTHYTEDQVIEVRQGPITLSEPTKFFRELVIKGKLVHDGSPLLTWCVSNAMEVDKGGGLIMLSKKHKDDTQRIDLLAAIINAMYRAMVNAKKDDKKPGIIFL
jgi:phage terminase large subunit-like protein